MYTSIYSILYIRKYTSQLIHSNLYLYSHGNKKQIILVLSSNTFKYCLYIYNFFIFHHIHTIKFISVQFQISLIQKITNLLLLFLLCTCSKIFTYSILYTKSVQQLKVIQLYLNNIISNTFLPIQQHNINNAIK